MSNNQLERLNGLNLPSSLDPLCLLVFLLFPCLGSRNSHCGRRWESQRSPVPAGNWTPSENQPFLGAGFALIQRRYLHFQSPQIAKCGANSSRDAIWGSFVGKCLLVHWV